MKDDDGRVTVPGYYDRIKLSDAERKILADTGDDEAAIRRRPGIKLAELVGGNLQEAIQYPSLNVRGMAAASIGEKASNIVPHQAIAEFDLRTTPEAPPIPLGLLKAHIEQQGYRLATAPPPTRTAPPTTSSPPSPWAQPAAPSGRRSNRRSANGHTNPCRRPASPANPSASA